MRSLILLAGLLTIAAGCHVPQYHFSRSVSETIETTPLSAVDLTTFNGGISVESHAEPTIEMEVTYKAYGMTEEQAEANCQLLAYDISADQGKLIIQATKPSDQWMASASFKLKVPETCAMKLRSSNGKISASDIAQTVDAHTSNGTIELKRISDSVTAKTSNGTVSVKDCTGTINLSTSNGRVLFAGELTGEDNVIHTSNGRVSIELPSDQLTEVATRTSNGSIQCSLPTQRVLEEGKKSFHAVVGEGDLRSTHAKLNVRTSNGSIKIDPWWSEEITVEVDEESLESEGQLVL